MTLLPPDLSALLSDESIEAARTAQGRVTLGGKYLISSEPDDLDTCRFYAIPSHEMRAAIAAAWGAALGEGEPS